MDIFTLLLNNGAKYDRRDRAGKTPFDVLMERIPRSYIKAYFKEAHFTPAAQKVLDRFENSVRISDASHKQRSAPIHLSCAQQTKFDYRENKWVDNCLTSNTKEFR